MADALGTGVHPHVGHEAAELFAKQGAYDQTQELETELLGVELEFALE